MGGVIHSFIDIYDSDSYKSWESYRVIRVIRVINCRGWTKGSLRELHSYIYINSYNSENG